MIHINDSQKLFTKRIHRNDSQKETHKKIHNMIHKNDSQNDSHKINSQLTKMFQRIKSFNKMPPSPACEY